jgi:hypothetical protein
MLKDFIANYENKGKLVEEFAQIIEQLSKAGIDVKYELSIRDDFSSANPVIPSQ